MKKLTIKNSPYNPRIKIQEIVFKDNLKVFVLMPLKAAYKDYELFASISEFALKHGLDKKKYIILDFSEVEDICSTAIGILVRLMDELQKKQCEIAIVKTSLEIYERFECIGIWGFIKHYVTIYQALVGFRCKINF